MVFCNLLRAAMFGHPTLIQYLVEKGADMEVVDVEQRTPLLVAASKYHMQSVNTLLALGADPFAKVEYQRLE